ncbi:uncharacterized protein [Procambarus clarkii]|uniref:uncharacterized protein n=1 Tax=Procambarus clarkii TaxID=6728 RepID=UPI003744689B
MLAHLMALVTLPEQNWKSLTEDEGGSGSKWQINKIVMAILINKSETISKATPNYYHQLEISLRAANLKFDQVRSTIRSYLDILNAAETDPDEIDQTLAETSQYEDGTQDKLNVLCNTQIFEGLRITVNRLKTHDKIKPEPKQPNIDNSVKPKSTLNKSNKFKPRTAPSTGKKSGNIGIYSVSPSETVVDVSAKKTNSARERKCLFCEQEHVTYKCNVYPNFNTRIKRLQELHKCTKCMGSHDPSKCVVHLRLCSRCNKGMHHYALCRKTSSQSITPREDSMNSTTVHYCNVHQEINVLATESGKNTTLPTAQLKLINRKYRVNSRGLFEQGSQKTFITQQLVEQLKLKPPKRVKLNISGFLTNSGPSEYQIVKVLERLGSSTNSI